MGRIRRKMIRMIRKKRRKGKKVTIKKLKLKEGLERIKCINGILLTFCP